MAPPALRGATMGRRWHQSSSARGCPAIFWPPVLLLPEQQLLELLALFVALWMLLLLLLLLLLLVVVHTLAVLRLREDSMRATTRSDSSSPGRCMRCCSR